MAAAPKAGAGVGRWVRCSVFFFPAGTADHQDGDGDGVEKRRD